MFHFIFQNFHKSEIILHLSNLEVRVVPVEHCNGEATETRSMEASARSLGPDLQVQVVFVPEV